MKCREITNDVLLDAAAGAAGPGVRAHLEACSRCRAELEAVRALAEDLERLGRARASGADSRALDRLLRKLDNAPSPRRSPAILRRLLLGSAAGAAAAAAAAVFLLSRPEPAPRAN
ncbi:MAG TPA: hypothetical protein VNO22_17790, partial [Planctomycetota bacterium]|nr:hypothetical protein [Planctomycetota bacterium]